MLRAYKYRIYPTAQQTELINKHFGCCRLVYNLALQVKNEAYKTQNKYLSAIDLCYQLPELKKEFEWLKEIDSQALQASIKKLDIAFKNYFRQLKDGTIEAKKKAYIKEQKIKGLPIDSGKLASIGFPKFKSKYDKQSFQCPNNTRRINWNEDTLGLPKIKGIPIVLSRTFKGKIKTVTIGRTPTNKYYASVLVETGESIPAKKMVTEQTAVGIDLGLHHFIVTSDGVKIDNPKYLRKKILHLKYLQRQASHKVKGSNNRRKANLKVAIQHERITNSRKDFLHKLSHEITNQYDTLCFEDLNIAGMTKNHKLAQAITDAGWGMYVDFCKYKAEWKGKNILQIPTFEPSTKLCNVCGAVNHTLTLADREWVCANCTTLHDRDENAAKVIKNYCLKNCGGVHRKKPVEMLALAKSTKQEVIRVGNYL